MTHGEALSTMERIEVHIVESEDLVGLLVKFEEILHWLPACKQLVIVMTASVGLLAGSYRQALTHPSGLCSGCKAAGASVTVIRLGGRYNELVDREFSLDCQDIGTGGASSPSCSFTLVPNNASLIVCPQCGLHDKRPNELNHYKCKNDLWMDDLKLFAECRSPVLFTAWDANEMMLDVRVATEVALEQRTPSSTWEVVVRPFHNPFRGLIPFPEHMQDNSFYFTNCCAFVMQNKTS